MRKILLLSLILFICGCVGSPVHSSLKYSSVQNLIKKNNTNLMKLASGLDKESVQELMGQPERSEGYPWGFAWLYRTAMTSGIYGTADADFTPVMFSEDGILQGWGRNYFTEYVKKYELTIKKSEGN